jgi:hypothetical protein
MFTRHPAQAGLEVLLFPFFDLMVCTLGVLILLAGSIVSLSLQTTGITITNADVETIRGDSQKTPLYIEWTGYGIMIYPSRMHVPIAMPPAGNTARDIARIEQDLAVQIRQSHFGPVLECLRQYNQTRYLVALVRPSGFESFLFFRDLVIALGVDIGYEPIGEHWGIASASAPCL